MRRVMWFLRIPAATIASAAGIRNPSEIQADPGEDEDDSIQTARCRVRRKTLSAPRSPIVGSIVR
jgi:hypothetical protein